jgi:hypothetical protein
MTNINSICRLMACLTILPISPAAYSANDGPLSITCEKEDFQSGSWSGPLTLTYSGGANGELNVESEHLALKLPATVIENTGIVDGVETSTTGIRGSNEMPSSMPDPKLLLDCSSKNISPDFKDDPDMQAMEIANCVPNTALSASPILVNASVTVGLIPTSDANAPDVIVEIKRRYVDAVTSLGKAIVIESFPKNCTLKAP